MTTANSKPGSIRLPRSTVNAQLPVHEQAARRERAAHDRPRVTPHRPAQAPGTAAAPRNWPFGWRSQQP